MSEVMEASLYQSVILDRSRNPRFRRRLAGPALLHGKCTNPLCGDEAAIELRLDAGGQIDDIGFTAEGCAISLAACDLMAEAARGLAPAEALALGSAFESMLGGGPDITDSTLLCFAPLRGYPSRRRCGTLPWQALATALGSEVT